MAQEQQRDNEQTPLLREEHSEPSAADAVVDAHEDDKQRVTPLRGACIVASLGILIFLQGLLDGIRIGAHADGYSCQYQPLDHHTVYHCR
jgi:hypothetical protein